MVTASVKPRSARLSTWSFINDCRGEITTVSPCMVLPSIKAGNWIAHYAAGILSLVNTMSTSSQKGADSSFPFGADPDSSGTFGWFLVSSTAGNYCSWDT